MNNYLKCNLNTSEERYLRRTRNCAEQVAQDSSDLALKIKTFIRNTRTATMMASGKYYKAL